MSTNPFRQIKFQQQHEPERPVLPAAQLRASDDSGSRAERNDLSLDTNVHHPDSGNRHVSFASPPVDRTIAAVSYPSSPESARSPPLQFAQPPTPNYRAAFSRDPFENLGNKTGEDKTIQEALHNAQTNTDLTQPGQEDAVKQTLGHFAPIRRPSTTNDSTAVVAPSSVPQRQALDVEAFTRLLLTGDSTKNDSRLNQNASPTADNGSNTDTNFFTHSSLFDVSGQFAEATPRPTHDHDRNNGEVTIKAPPPAPAPRRGKSVKLKDQPSQPDTASQEASQPQLRTAPAPPTARRTSQNAVNTSEEDSTRKQLDTEARSDLTIASPKLVPPPPPIRRQPSVSQRRRSSDLTPTAEEPGHSQLPNSSRRSSADRPPAPPSRNSSASIKRQSVGMMQPPPVPPARRGRESSRSSMDSFRPSLSSIIGDDNSQENSLPEASIKGSRNLTPSSADSILAELANLQKEVEAARRTA